MSYKKAAKKFALALPDGGQIGRDLPLRWRGGWRGAGVSPFGCEPRRRLETACAGALTPSPGQGFQGFVDFTALGFYGLLLFPLSNFDNASSINLSS